MGVPQVELRGKVLRWGNSYALRLRKADLERLGFRPGDEVGALLFGWPDKIDLSGLRTFRGGPGFDTVAQHDEAAGEGYWQEHQRTRRADPGRG